MKVLLIGNSQMQSYDLPRMLTVMSGSAPASHPKLDIGQFLKGGATLRTHWESGDAPGLPRSIIASDKWDWVVLQEIYSAGKNEFEKYAELFDEFIRMNGSKTLLFATASVTSHYKSSLKFPDSTASLNDMQIEFGKRKGIPVAAAGYAWMRYLGPNPAEAQLLDLYHADKGHPGAKGTYIYACLLYAHMTGLKPANLASEFRDIREGICIGKAEALKMQEAAWEEYSSGNSRFKIPSSKQMQ